MLSIMYVTGFNLFGQWFLEKCKITRFTKISDCNRNREIALSLISSSDLLVISWSYNVFQYNQGFYIIGSINGADHQLLEICFPKDCSIDNVSEINIIGNDHIMLLFKKDGSSFWKINFEDISCDNTNWNWIKLPNFINETQLSSEIKRIKSSVSVVKVVTKHLTCVCLTNDGRIYDIPNEVNTSDCFGKVIDIDSGYEHTIAVTDSGAVYTWGNGRHCQLGHGDLNNIEEPTQIEALAGINIVKVKAGGWHCLALSDSGDLYTWGWNDAGQLGVYENNKNELSSSPIPVLVDFYDEFGNILDLNIKDIACGSKHSAVLASDDSVWTTGLNKYGQLGIESGDKEFIHKYTKVYNCNNNRLLVCGPWITVIINTT